MYGKRNKPKIKNRFEIERSRRSSDKYGISYALPEEDEITDEDDVISQPQPQRKGKETKARSRPSKMVSKSKSNNIPEGVNAFSSTAENMEQSTSTAESDLSGVSHVNEAGENTSALIRQIKIWQNLKLYPVFGKKTKKWDNDAEVLKFLENVAAKAQK